MKNSRSTIQLSCSTQLLISLTTPVLLTMLQSKILSTISLSLSSSVLCKLNPMCLTWKILWLLVWRKCLRLSMVPHSFHNTWKELITVLLFPMDDPP
ncbi:hypothetical protein ES288_A03G099600v1 [Gossypium darwinii]|uniref:Uncharacterized protein n=1 Tax=Gossypium darwinii TaxID=34276 RepID=A0A5D2H3Q3_GOSDA|nr:hypothetical protein ES288_A03G099600v1 [Gossypium darwinii]